MSDRSIPVHETSPGSFTVQFPKDTMTGTFKREEAGMTNKLTTEEVRDDYQWGVNACGCCAEREEIDLVRFDAWLTEVRAEAWESAVDCLSAHWEDVAPKAIRDLEERNPYRGGSDE